MNTDLVQAIRYKLQKRMVRLGSTEYRVFHLTLKQFWGFLRSHDVLQGILEDLPRRVPDAAGTADRIVGKQEGLFFDDELENAAVAYHVLRLCVGSNNPDAEFNLGLAYGARDADDALDKFRALFLEPFYEYIDEQLDDQRAILAVLRRYKQKCEWFQRERLHTLWRENTSRGEHLLGYHLYEYLHDQGLEFVIEPLTASGRPDLVSAQASDDPLVADVKVFDGKTRNKSYIAAGFNQVYLYTRDCNQPFGYLVVYNVSDTDLKLVLPHQEQSTPFLVHNAKSIFVLTIDINPSLPSASKRGKVKCVELTEKDLVETHSDNAKADA
ncbi:hypothetical protein CH330_00315 [candidate division WOR-3 bacterium JGI_Cruoil_03_51_56]|uniref:Uncharacterized protein n=1 Tax=candidate division WOR-3 bacterium JGI_Cruoil_03_51_56 TaxID=1973747 RepID=A0A235BYD3_UNCW3|nr:MAG: hypothetical protein CH330_00315 [candidate division WOR-3 bacterium JGI_Cruoil_03_51_56]